MKEKILKIIEIIFVIGLVAFAILSYPWVVSTENGETHCYNLLGKEQKCR